MWITHEESTAGATGVSPATAPSEAAKIEPVRSKPAPAPEFQEWGTLVEEIRQGDQRAMEQLYKIFAKGIRFQLCRQLGLQELDDKVHDIFLIVVQAIQRGELRNRNA